MATCGSQRQPKAAIFARRIVRNSIRWLYFHISFCLILATQYGTTYPQLPAPPPTFKRVATSVLDD